MDKEKAQQIVVDIAAFRRRWGQLAGTGTGDYSVEDLMDAIVVLDEQLQENGEDFSVRETKLKRQLTASKAREAKLKKQVYSLQEKLREVS